MGETVVEGVEEEFRVWKKNAPFLYDLVISHALEWPSLTVQFLPTSLNYEHCDPSFAVHKVSLGTHTAEGSPNFLLIADAILPLCSASYSDRGSDSNSENLTLPKVEITQKIRVDGEVNRARCMPQNPSLIAAKTSGTNIYVFDSVKDSTDDSFDPHLILKGHSKEGYGLSWNPLKTGYLVSGSNDNKICMWDVSALTKNKVLDAIHVFEVHEDVVEDVSWHWKNENLFGSVGDDCKLMIWDMRVDKPGHCISAHEEEVNYLSFNSYNEWILATASSDTTVSLFDMRKLMDPLHILSGHTEEVFQVEWDPSHETVLASSGNDRRLMIWDLNRVGDEQQEGEAGDGPSELLFSHGGHRAKISDFSWNTNEPWVISSVAEDNSLQIWQVAESIYRQDEELCPPAAHF